MRTANINRETAETRVAVELNLDGAGAAKIDTGIAFFDHMLTLLFRHALIDATIKAVGDIAVDGHHTVEDTGIVIGQALDRALGDKRGINRYGSMLLPMEEALAQIALDFSGRPLLVYRANFSAARTGDFDVALAREFFRALTVCAKMNLHIALLSVDEPHHSLEAIFKGVGRSLRQAVALDPRETGIPSSKGTLA
ncbi:MAG: imidazoleglycerol-phosphate dehydratase HisB [Planctomycetota bacterium]|jgi:imidazoleglycerol-phosphate dehydratase|nr:imidazoleglycerol-phosphate dehydratase HisB [Planctomycetota bacterium]